jgi:hypothetical protein
MNNSESDQQNRGNPLRGAVAAGLTFPIHAKIVSVNGTTTEVLFESAVECHTLSMQMPMNFPCEWTLTGANQLKATFTQTAKGMEEAFERVQKGVS